LPVGTAAGQALTFLAIEHPYEVARIIEEAPEAVAGAKPPVPSQSAGGMNLLRAYCASA
jgi:hypothetical protein